MSYVCASEWAKGTNGQAYVEVMLLGIHFANCYVCTTHWLHRICDILVADSTNIKIIAKNQRCSCVSWRYHAWETSPLIAINLKSRNCTNIKTTSTDLHTWAHHRRCITTTNIRIKLNMVRVRTRKTYLRSGCTIVFYKGITVEQRVCVHTYLCIC